MFVTSFDFLFVSATVSITHACLIDMVEWNTPRAGALLALGQLYHWVLVVDPGRRLSGDQDASAGLSFVAGGQIVLLFVCVQLFAVLALVYCTMDATAVDSRLRLLDNGIYRFRLNGRDHEIQVAPLLLVIALSWSGRLLWRLMDRGVRNGVLVMFQGTVQYNASNVATATAATSHRAP